MDFSNVVFTKRKVLRLILSSYLDGFSSEEIMLRLNFQKIDLTIKEINEILDYLIDCNY